MRRPVGGPPRLTMHDEACCPINQVLAERKPYLGGWARSSAASNKKHFVRWQPCRLESPCTMPSQGMHVFSATGLVPVSQIRLRLLCPSS